MNKILIVSIILALIVLSLIIISYSFKKEQPETRLYSGPVPQGYDENHFRLTGETIPLVKETS